VRRGGSFPPALSNYFRLRRLDSTFIGTSYEICIRGTHFATFDMETPMQG
jgi:hypothetical protein